MRAMIKNKSSTYRWAWGVVFTPALVGVVFGFYIVLTNIYTQIKSNDEPASFIDGTIIFFCFPVFVGIVGLFFYLPPALILAVIAVSIHEQKTIKSLLILVISAGFLTSGWLIFLDDIFFSRRTGHWSSFLWFIQGWGYAGPAFVAVIGTLIFEVTRRYFTSEKYVPKITSDQ